MIQRQVYEVCEATVQPRQDIPKPCMRGCGGVYRQWDNRWLCSNCTHEDLTRVKIASEWIEADTHHSMYLPQTLVYSTTIERYRGNLKHIVAFSYWIRKHDKGATVACAERILQWPDVWQYPTKKAMEDVRSNFKAEFGLPVRLLKEALLEWEMEIEARGGAKS